MGIFNKTTIEHSFIRRWAEKFLATPQLIDDPESLADKIGLRLDFPGKKDDPIFDKSKYKDISWEEFFTWFEKLELGFVYDDIKKPKDPSLCYRFAKRSEMNKKYTEAEE